MEDFEKKTPESNRLFVKKLFVIIVFLLLLLVPLFYVEKIIIERESYKNEAAESIKQSWAGAQVIKAPIFLIKNNESKHRLEIDDLNVQVDVMTEYRKKGIFKIPVYVANIKTTGHFLNPSGGDVNGIVAFRVEDIKGYVEKPIIIINGVDYSNSSENANVVKIKNAPVSISFENSYKLRGTDYIKFQLGGKTNKIQVSGNWRDPSFEGDFLPDKRAVSSKGFNAQWSVPEIAVNLKKGEASRCGVSFLTPVDSYRMVLRTVKYGFLFLSLTFLSFFIFEITTKSKPVHPFQYGLIGLSMIIFYLLLTSISEFIWFTPAYVLAVAMTVSLITWYTYFAVAKEDKTPAKLIAGILVLLYTYLYSVLKLQDFSLLLGSFGLFFVILLIMYVTRDIEWYKE